MGDTPQSTCIVQSNNTDTSTVTPSAYERLPTIYFKIDPHYPNYHDLIKYEFEDDGEWPTAKERFWSYIRSLNPYVEPRKIDYKPQQKHFFNHAAFSRRINFPKSGHLCRRTRRRLKSRKS